MSTVISIELVPYPGPWTVGPGIPPGRDRGGDAKVLPGRVGAFGTERTAARVRRGTPDAQPARAPGGKKGSAGRIGRASRPGTRALSEDPAVLRLAGIGAQFTHTCAALASSEAIRGPTGLALARAVADRRHRPGRARSSRRSGRARPDQSRRVTPNMHATVAPVGRSSSAEASTPSRLTSAPNAHPDPQAPRHRPTEDDPRQRRDDEVGEHKEDARDPHGARHDESKRRVEEEVPEPAPASPPGRPRPGPSRSRRRGGGTPSGRHRPRRTGRRLGARRPASRRGCCRRASGGDAPPRAAPDPRGARPPPPRRRIRPR